MDEVMFGHDLLERASASVQFPATPQLRTRVLAKIAAPPVREMERWRARALPALATATIVLAAASGVTLAVPSSRSAVADFFGIEGSKIEILPTPAGGLTPTPFPTPSEIDPNAVASSLEKAALAAGFEPALPRDEDPERVYTVQYGNSTALILRYDNFDLWEIRTDGSFDGTFGKGGGPGSTIRDLNVNGLPARWVAGGPHFVRYIDAQGNIDESTERIVGRDTLIWRTEFALYRMETTLLLADAVGVAEALP